MASRNPRVLDGTMLPKAVRSKAEGAEKTDKRPAEVADPKGSPEDKRRKEEDAKSELDAQRLPDLADKGLQPSGSVPAVSLPVVATPATLPTQEAGVNASSSSMAIITIGQPSLPEPDTESQLVARLNSSGSSRTRAPQLAPALRRQSRGSGVSSVESMIIEMKRANALATNTVRSQREFMESVVQAQQNQHNQMAELMKAMVANQQASNLPAPLPPAQAPAAAEVPPVENASASVEEIARKAAEASRPAVRATEEKTELEASHKKLMAVLARKLERKLLIYVKLSEK